MQLAHSLENAVLIAMTIVSQSHCTGRKLLDVSNRMTALLQMSPVIQLSCYWSLSLMVLCVKQQLCTAAMDPTIYPLPAHEPHGHVMSGKAHCHKKQ